MHELIIILFAMGIISIVGIGILGCIATIEESEYRNYKARYDDDGI